MADTGSPNTNSAAAAASADTSIPPQQQDWEMLTMSMSASAFGKPDPAGESSKSEEYTTPTPDQNPNPSESVENSSDAQVVAPSPWAGRLSSTDAVEKSPEPFTEGWKPRMSSSITDFPVLGSEHAPSEVEFQEAQSFAVQSESSSFMAVSASSCVTATEKEMYDDVTEGDGKGPGTVSETYRVSKKRSTWCKQPRVSSAMVSIAFTAAVVGFAILGRRWHVERYHNEQLRLELSSKNEQLNDLAYQVSRMKDILREHQKISVIGSSGY